MKRFVEGEDRLQGALLPHCLDDYVTENNPVRVIEAFIDELDLATLGFDGVVPETTGRPAFGVQGTTGHGLRADHRPSRPRLLQR